MIEYQLISHLGKRENRGEIIVTLFEWCDLTCKFCNQDHSSTAGMATIRNKEHAIWDGVEKLRLVGKNKFSIHLMGGELFSDAVPDHCFSDYTHLYDTFNDDDIEVCITTNFVFSNRARVEELLIACPDLQLLTSYDPSGRFSEDNESIFLNNINHFKERVKSINVIMTKPNIRKFLSGSADSFVRLYNDGFKFFFDYYTPEKNMSIMSPTDVEIRDLMMLMIDKYPLAEPFNSMIRQENRGMSCQDTYTITPAGNGGFCTILLDNQNAIIPKQKMEKGWVEEYGCLECKHFKRCGLGCFLGNHIKSYKTQDVCWLSEVYDYVDNRSTASIR